MPPLPAAAYAADPPPQNGCYPLPVSPSPRLPSPMAIVAVCLARLDSRAPRRRCGSSSRCGNFDIPVTIPHEVRSATPPHTRRVTSPMCYVLPVPIGCWLGLAIRCCARFTSLQACSFYCRVFVNGKEIGDHRAGGYVAFHLDVPAATLASAGGTDAGADNELFVLVFLTWA